MIANKFSNPDFEFSTVNPSWNLFRNYFKILYLF